jgi:hypothetical protein
MKCEKCNYEYCGDDECRECDELLCTGLCPSCNIDGECSYCHSKINLKKDNHITTVMYAYFCNENCYDKWKV